MAAKNGKNAYKTYQEENVITERVEHVIEQRVPWLMLGLIGGIATAVIVSEYEAILQSDVRLAFFIPLIVYLSDAVGTQTETIYVRALANSKKIHFAKYILKESVVGLGIGIIAGVTLWAVATFWLDSFAVGLTVGLTMLINLTSAPVLAVVIPNMLYKRRADPALGAGPVATIIQDLISLLVYFFVASIIFF